MKSKIYKCVLTMILMFSVESIFSQENTVGIAFYDAIKLEEIYKPDTLIPASNPTVQKILEYYFSDDSDIAKEVMNNPFLKSFFKDGSELASIGISKINTDKITLQKIAGLPVNNFTEGISAFLIKRAKEELTVAFFNRFKSFADKNPEFRVLFPKTTDNLINLLASHYPEMLSTLRDGFYEDIKNISYHLDNVLALDRYKEKMKNNPEIVVIFKLVRLVHELEIGKNPAEIISGFSDFPELRLIPDSSGLVNVKPAFLLADVLSQSLRNSSDQRTWVSLKDFKTEMLNNDVAFKIYLGLVYEIIKKKDIQFRVKKDMNLFEDIATRQKNEWEVLNVADLLKSQNEYFSLFRNYVNEFLELAERFEKARLSGEEKYYEYVDVSIDVIEYGFDFVKLLDDRFVMKDYTSVARKCNDLYKNIYEKSYSQAITNAVDILNELNVIIDDKRLSRCVSKITKYGLFMANVVEADSPEEIESLLESTVLPVGSSSIKKNSNWNLSVQSYLGAFYRFESNSNAVTTRAWDDEFGVHAPIGLSLNKGLRKAGSIGVFASILDVGAIVDYQLKVEKTVDENGNMEELIEKDYEIQLGQIFSPGIYAVYGFPFNLPISFGIGKQYGPGLSKIDVNTGTPLVEDNPAWRFNAFLSVDIPFYTLVNVNRKYKKK